MTDPHGREAFSPSWNPEPPFPRSKHNSSNERASSSTKKRRRKQEKNRAQSVAHPPDWPAVQAHNQTRPQPRHGTNPHPTKPPPNQRGPHVTSPYADPPACVDASDSGGGAAYTTGAAQRSYTPAAWE